MRDVPGLRAAVAVAVATALAASVVAGLRAQSSDAKRSAREGVYTREQAARGKGQYEYFCARCHLGALEGDEGRDVPPLAGDVFASAWRDHTVKDLFDSVRTRMPADSPASLDSKTYIDIVAYILQANGFPPGRQELGLESGPLAQLAMPFDK